MQTADEPVIKQKASPVDETLRYLTYVLVTASGFMIWDLIAFFTAGTAERKLNATTPESSLQSLLFAFGSWALIYTVSGAWLSVRNRTGGLLFIGIGLAGVALTATTAFFTRWHDLLR